MRIITFLFLGFLIFGKANAQVEAFQLPNGLTVLVKEDHRSPLVVTMLWYKVGSADEIAGATGIAHALEHLMFKGTKQHPAGSFSKKIASIGGVENAFTSYDYTAYYEKFSKEHLSDILALEADRMTGLMFDEQEFNKEIKVIQEERRQRIEDNPQGLLLERYLSSAYLRSPYRQPVIGWMDEIKQMKMTQLKDWYKQFYAPNNATLVVVGDVQAKAVQRLVQQHFASIPKQELTFKRSLYKEPESLGAKSLEVKANVYVPLIAFGYPVPSLNAAEDKSDAYALKLIQAILDSNDSSRLSKKLRLEKELASGFKVDYGFYARSFTQFIFFAIPNRNHTLPELKQGIWTEIKRLQTELISEKELNRVKRQFLAEKIYEQDSVFEQAMALGLFETIGLGHQTLDEYLDEINKITSERIQAVARAYFIPQAETQAVLLPNERKEDKNEI